MATTIQIGTVFEEAPVISANGQYLVFREFDQIFLRDLFTGETNQISVSPEGEEGNSLGSSSFDSLAISADGRFVAFESGSTNLVPNDTNGESDIFLRDTVEGTTSLISLDSDGNQIPANTFDTQLRPSISSDGRFVAFQTDAPFGGGPHTDIFVRNIESNITELISVNSEGVPADGVSFGASISADGRFVAFYSLADNLVAEETIIDYDVFIRDRQNQTTVRASVNSQGQEGTGVSENEIPDSSEATNPVMSPDGSYVVFESSYTNLVSNDTNGFSDIFKHDLETGETTRISVDSNGNQANGGSLMGFSKSAISADGRYIVFQSGANNLVEGDTNNATDVFVRDTVEETTTRVSVNSNGEEPVGGYLETKSVDGTISGDGRYIVFISNGSNMNDEGIDTDLIYLRDTSTSNEPEPEPGDETQTIDLFRFRNTTFDTGTYVFVGEAEKDAILADEDLNNTFSLDGQNSDGTVNPAFTASSTPEDDLLPFYRLRSLDVPGTFLFVSTAEYDGIFAEDSIQRDKWEQEGFDAEGEDIAEFYLLPPGADSGEPFNRYQNTDNGTFLYAGAAESDAIDNDSNLSNIFTNQGGAFNSLI